MTNQRLLNIERMNAITFKSNNFSLSKFKIMRHITIIIALFCFCTALVANNPYSSGETLNVVANAGLKMRLTPDLNGELIKVIPYGERVEVLNNNDALKSEVLEYVSGNWLLVSYEGQTGYVFDGYLTPLSIPSYDFELNMDNIGFMNSLEAYVNYRFISIEVPDTIMGNNGMTKVVQRYNNDAKMTQVYNINYSQIILELSDIRLMDAYHLLISMLADKDQKENFLDHSIFITDTEGQTERININIEEQTIIDKLPNGNVRIRLLRYDEGC